MGRLATLLMTLTAVACSRGQPTVSTGISAGISGIDFQEQTVTAVILGALTGEAAGAATDTLFVNEAPIIVNGRTRTASPLFAGVGQGGQVAITSSQLEIKPNSSWGIVDYRWETRDGVAREGRATFVLAEVEAGKWRIQHVHSSSPR
jgi:hypothetical protein